MTDEEKLETMDDIADALLDTVDMENVVRLTRGMSKLFAGQTRADCWVAVAYALAGSALGDKDNSSAKALLGVARIMQRIQDDEGDDED
jgi:hypothetical protein